MIDHLLVAVFAIGFPALTAPVYARRRPHLRAGDWEVKRREYLETVLWLSGMGVATLVVWVVAGRDLSALGLSFEVSWQSLVSLGLAAGGAALLFLQLRGVKRDPRVKEAVRRAAEPVSEYLPSSREELRWFRAVAYSAGIGEELFYRGFLIWYLGQFVPLLWAVVASSVLFGCAHIMHGVSATVRATVTGFVLAGLFLFSGALWSSMLLHTAVDLSAGATGLALYGGDSSVRGETH